MSLTIAGKCEPETEQLDRLEKAGFTAVELYTSTEMLDNRSVRDIIDTCTTHSLDIVSVHTPHLDINNDRTDYFSITDTIATKLQSTLVLDAYPLSIYATRNLYPPETISAENYGYENDPSVSKFYIRANHLPDYPLILDTAHLHMSEESYIPFIEELIANYSERIPVIHLAEGTRKDDGKPFEQGTVELKRIIRLLDRYNYSNPVVLETPKKDQSEALEFSNSFL